MVGKPLTSTIKDELRDLSGQRQNKGGTIITRTITRKKDGKKLIKKEIDSAKKESRKNVINKSTEKNDTKKIIDNDPDEYREIHIKNKKGTIINTYRLKKWKPRQHLVYNSKIALIGKPGSGKSTAIADICWQFKDFIPVASVFSGTETENGFYSNFFPPVFISEYYDEKRLLKFLIRQRNLSQKVMESIKTRQDPATLPDPKALLILDDLADQGCFDRRLFKTIFKMGRHWHMLVILALQNALDMKPHLRQTVDYLVLFKEMQKKPLEKLYAEYAGCVPTLDEFRQIMKTINEEKYTALVIDNKGQGTSIEECLYWWKADCHPAFKFGCDEYQIQGRLMENTVKYDPLKVIIKEMKKEIAKKGDKKKK